MTRIAILGKAVSRFLEVSSLNDAKPQSSVVASCSTGIIMISIRLRTSSAVSIRGVDGSNYAGKIRCLDFRFAQQIFDEFRSGRRLAFGSIAPTGDAGPGSSQA